MPEHDAWSRLADRFVEQESATLKGQVRHHVLHQHLTAHLPAPPASIVDIGGGAANQSLPLARLGYDVTVADPSPAMLDKAADRVAQETPAVQQRLHLVEIDGRRAPERLGNQRFAGVLCHGVIMYVAKPEPLVSALCELAGPGGLVSIMALNAKTMAVRPALEGRWSEALPAFDSRREVGVLGADTRADTVEELTGLLARHGVQQAAWYGVWLFTDGWTGTAPQDRIDEILAVELEASRRDPYRQLSRVFHLVGRKAAR